MSPDTLIQIASGVVIAAMTGGITLAGKWILNGQTTIKEKIDTSHTALDQKLTSLEPRVTHLEQSTMTKEDLNRAFEHESAGRKAIKEASEHLIRKNAEDIINLRCDVARLDQNDINMTQRLDLFSSQVDKRFDKIDAGQEEIRKCLGDIAKKVG